MKSHHIAAVIGNSHGWRLHPGIPYKRRFHKVCGADASGICMWISTTTLSGVFWELACFVCFVRTRFQQSIVATCAMLHARIASGHKCIFMLQPTGHLIFLSPTIFWLVTTSLHTSSGYSITNHQHMYSNSTHHTHTFPTRSIVSHKLCLLRSLTHSPMSTV